MEVEFKDPDLERIAYELSFTGKLSKALVEAFRRKLQIIVDATDERDLRDLKSLHFEKLKGDREGQHSVRLNNSHRLCFRIEGSGAEKVVVILEVVDYH